MTLDPAKIEDAVLALLLLGLHDGGRAWKGFDWDALNRLHERGYISDPRGRAKSVVFTDEGLARAGRLLAELFGKADGTGRGANSSPAGFPAPPTARSTRQSAGTDRTPSKVRCTPPVQRPSMSSPPRSRGTAGRSASTGPYSGCR
jgi:hypothetical protein